LRWQGDCCELFGIEVVEEILHPAIIPAAGLGDRMNGRGQEPIAAA
jgi:hypothetical protein